MASRRKAGFIIVALAFAFSATVHLRHDSVHLGGGESPAGGRVNVAHRSQMQNGGCRRFIMPSFQDHGTVVVAQGPVHVPDLNAHFSGLSLEDRRTPGCMVDVLDALLAESEGHSGGRL